MKEDKDIVAEYVDALRNSARLGDQVVYHKALPDTDALYAENRRPWVQAIKDMLAMQGITQLYAHQTLATDHIRAGRHVVVATPTASGKSLVYNLPVIERFLQDPDARGLYLFPLKALAQDQLKSFQSLTAHWPKEARPDAAIYDGDTTPHFRKKIRTKPPTVLMTNPEMLHLSILPYHEQWIEFLASLQFIVVDEVHTYRGVMGSHMAQLFRRLLRVCKQYGITPTFIFCSATVGNPAELCENLTGIAPTVITESGAPQGKRNFVFMDPHQSPSSTAISLLKSALMRNMRTIVYTQSRKMTELISMWAGQKSGAFKDKISAYRAGFLPEERREIEQKMASGELLAVISTSALELGIDIGALDLCILVGYPGSIMSTMQRGGRVGRKKQESAVVLVAGEDALDQYFMRHPKEFFTRPPESAVLNPHNPVILKRHLECAAAELTLRTSEEWMQEQEVIAAVHELEQCGLLLRDAEGTTIFAAKKRPHRHVDLRGAGNNFHIESEDGTVIGSVDGVKAFKETHPGAVYLHKGQTWSITELDFGTRTAKAKKGRVNYYTRTRCNKSTEILEVIDQTVVWGSRLCFGKLRVTEIISGFEKRSVQGGKLLGITPLELPPLVFETEGIWFEVPLGVQRKVEDEFLHFMGSIHALEHAMIGILPILVLTDRNDLGGISTPMHAQVGKPAVFVYDGMEGGAGLTRHAFTMAQEIFERTLATVRDCGCELGCPSCVHSPKCGSGNRPIDKVGSIFLLEEMAKGEFTPPEDEVFEVEQLPQPMTTPARIKPKVLKAEAGQTITPVLTDTDSSTVQFIDTPKRYAVLDIETQLSAQEVGGWHRADRMRVSVAVLYDSKEDKFIRYMEEDMPDLLEHLKEFDCIIGFNIIRFDYKVLSAYADYNLKSLPTLDLLDEIRKRLNYRVSLDNLGSATLNAPKSADGLQALKWWKEGKVEEIATYCEADVRITRDIYLYGKEHGYLLFTNKAKQKVRVPIAW
ncbi:DEAD/DEAH box helicase [Halodesulfovibrio marinisediminis]|uniref:DEAD/DEAH box helicase domain-containing protein n=1 Tax=Halodesulfovibrio marinisediminis DSM 17456 TaxID=1121457 RepID=A0A1N6F9G2_9BACT|nr:DEAD/DEAH box helicase [Halodesulfovibrio marinisediminis]SIN91933.1 DEAD/DEAH box helicase domain-containing protein [Halodesulfovibrio marinisediminis DSM 17456]